MVRAVLAAALFAASASSQPIVDTKWGKVEGHVDKESGTEYYWGIPFASPPVGDLRFAPPVDPVKWEGVKKLNGKLQPAECPQLHVVHDVSFGEEDCLTLDVYRPEGVTVNSSLPVMAWIYGGGFVLGADDQGNAYNGRNLAKKHNRIVVAMNYRVGSLGFMAIQAMFNEHNTTGNYGLLDQQFGLRWISQNIKYFGGNPDNVMIFGESAGGVSVIAQLAMPGSKPYFHAAAAESSVPVSDVSFLSYENSTKFGEFYAEYVGCPVSSTQLQCLRGLTVAEVLSPLLEWRRKFPESAQSIMPRLMPVMGYWPTVDGTTIPMPPIDQVKAGVLNDVPLIIGTNHDEGTTFSPLTPLLVNGGEFPIIFDKNGWERTLRHFLNETASEAADEFYMKQFPTHTYTYKQRTQHLITDFFFACPSRTFARALATTPSHRSPVYIYQFNQTLNTPSYNASGDFHGSEIPYVFNLPSSHWLPADAALSDKMSGWWSSIAATSVITCPTCPKWNPYTLENDNFMSLMTPTQEKTGIKQAVCDFWDKWGFYNNP